MFALLAGLANAAIVAVVSAQDSAVFNTSAVLFGNGNSATSNCGTSGPSSCSIDPPPGDTCCYEYPGGLLLQTQFWDTHPAIGPSNSWTIHGLWPDNCDGSFEHNCDPSRYYHNLGDLLDEQGAHDTRSYLEKYMINNKHQTEQFWEHEWQTHGTCYNTLKPSCLPRGSPRGAEAVAYFQRIVDLFQALPTYEWLASAGITPGTRTYDLDDVIRAIRDASGVTPAVECTGSSVQISYYFYLKGSLLDGEFVPIDSPVESKCSSGHFKYLPKSSH